jgi:hypothetical protein
MKRFSVVALCFLVMAFAAVAAEQGASTKAAPASGMAVTEKIDGTIIDNACAEKNKANLAEFIKTHPKSCALMPACTASGYSIYTTDGKLIPFDKVSNTRIEKFLKKKAGRLDVSVMARNVNGTLSLISITNAKKAPAPAKNK